MEKALVMPIIITRGHVFEDYVFIPNPLTGTGQDLTGIYLQAQMRYGSTLLGTFTITLDTPPDVPSGTQGWIKIRMDNDETTAIPTGYTRGAWSLLASIEADNPTLVCGGSVDILPSITTWITP